jgi:predicted flavoprotein YhiN
MADEVEGWTDRDTTASAMEALRAMFGTNVPDPLGSQISRWRQDPFALGAYSFKAVGTRTKDRKALFGPDWENRLFFAGEVLDVDGITGGFNFQHAWSSGFVAGSAVAARLK